MNIALKTAKNYYGIETVWVLQTIRISENDRIYNNEGIESEYGFGEIIVFDVIANKDDDITNRVVSVVKDSNDEWIIINEGIFS